MKKTVYEAITKRIIGDIISDIEKVIAGEKILLPWQKQWVGGESPNNPVTGTTYKGSNVFMLNHIANHMGYSDNKWFSYGVTRSHKARILKDEFRNNSWVVHFHYVSYEDKDSGEAKGYPQLKTYKVWNVDQMEHLGSFKLPEKEEREDFIPHEKSMNVLNDYIDERSEGLSLNHGGNRAFYKPSSHSITMPERKQFTDQSAYPHTLFHEAVHSTGYHTLLDRKLTGQTGRQDYSCEELVAEMGSQMLANICGLEIDYDNSLEYIRGWLSAIEMNPKWLVSAGAKAQKAVNLILGVAE